MQAGGRRFDPGWLHLHIRPAPWLGIHIDEAQARELEGLLAGSPGAREALEQIAGERSREVRRAVREAFVDALGTSLKLSAA